MSISPATVPVFELRLAFPCSECVHSLQRKVPHFPNTIVRIAMPLALVAMVFSFWSPLILPSQPPKQMGVRYRDRAGIYLSKGAWEISDNCNETDQVVNAGWNLKQNSQ